VYCATPEEIEVLTDRAMRLRLEGNTYERIAKTIGYSYKRTYDFVQMALARRRDITDELAAQLRKVQLERLYRIYEAHAPTVESVKSAMVMLKVLEREARSMRRNPSYSRPSFHPTTTIFHVSPSRSSWACGTYC
jgi:hypothetical protein